MKAELIEGGILINNMSPLLENVEKVHRTYPRTYSIPRREQRHGLQVGDIVKLVFLLDRAQGGRPRAERLWVRVHEVAAAAYIGTLDNDPLYLTQLKAGDHIPFGPEHVAALYQPHKQLPTTGQYALISPDLLTFATWPQRLERHRPQDEQSSGWHLLLSTTGTQPEQLVPYAVEDILQQFPILDSVLHEPIGTAWVWDAEQLEYRAAAYL